MKRKSKYLICAPVVLIPLLGALIPLLNSCGLILLKLSGNLKKPKLENTETIKHYTTKFKDPYDFLWMPDNKAHFEEIVKRYTGIPEVLIYDLNYNVLENARGESCQKRLIAFFTDSLQYKYKKVNDSSFFFLREKTMVVESKSEPIIYDYTIIYCWAKWAPKLTKDVFDRLRELKQSNKYKIRFISLNKDWQKGHYDKAPKISRKVRSGGSAIAPKY